MSGSIARPRAPDWTEAEEAQLRAMMPDHRMMLRDIPRDAASAMSVPVVSPRTVQHHIEGRRFVLFSDQGIPMGCEVSLNCPPVDILGFERGLRLDGCQCAI